MMVASSVPCVCGVRWEREGVGGGGGGGGGGGDVWKEEA